MKIHEHKVGTVAKIVPNIGEAFCYETEIVKPIKKEQEGYILLRPIKNEDGKYYNFNSLPCVLELYPDESECVYRYRISRMGYFRWHGKDYFVIFSKDDVDIYNRRLQFRMPYLKQAKLQVGNHTKVRDCWIHDISVNGMSVSIDNDKDFKCDLDTIVYVSFERDENYNLYKLKGNVARCVKRETDEAYTTLGIYIEHPPRDWAGFVSRLQREELQRRKSNRILNM